MRKIKSSCRYLTFASVLLPCCMVVVIIGPIGHISAAPPTVKGVTPVVECATSPVWINNLKSVYFIDGSRKGIYKYEPGSKEDFTVTQLGVSQSMATFIVPINAEGTNETTFGLSQGDRISVFPWDGKNVETVYTAYNWVISDFITCGKVDSNGRLWVGTSYSTNPDDELSPIRGNIYLLGLDGSPQKRIEDICVPSGIAWSPAEDRMYFVDYTLSQIVANTFKINPGEIVDDAKVIFDFAANNITCGPNDMTVDADGNLWIACVDASCIVKIDIKTGTVTMQVDIPGASKITSLTFGGPTLEDVYVTTCSNSPLFVVFNTGSKGIAAKTVKAGPPPPP